MSDSILPSRLSHWQSKLQLEHFSIKAERISPSQVCNDHHKRGISFVGICTDHEKCEATLYHTRKLEIDDLIHELLHVKYPLWTENEINKETQRILLHGVESGVNQYEVL